MYTAVHMPESRNFNTHEKVYKESTTILERTLELRCKKEEDSEETQGKHCTEDGVVNGCI